jgi:erythromycin esterase
VGLNTPRIRTLVLVIALTACSPPIPAVEGPAPVASALPKTPALEGRVVDSAGQPAAGAFLTATFEMDWTAETPTSHFAQTDARGEFRFEGLPSGTYRLNATTSTGWASASKPVDHRIDRPTVLAPLVLEREGFLGRGFVRDERGRPLPMAKVEALPILPTDAEAAFGTVANAEGEFALTLPLGEAFLLVGTAPNRKRAYGRLESAAPNADLQLSAEPVAMPDRGIVSRWLASAAHPIQTDDPKASLDDIVPLMAWIGDARIVALGEATHGTAEFFRLKHRLITLLVSKLDFSIVAFECGAVEAQLVNAYVRDGVGDPVEVVRKLGTDPYATQEIVDFVRWMRAYNADRRHPKKLSFVGFDATSWTSAARLREFLRGRDADPSFDAALARLAGQQADSTYPALARGVHEETRVALQALHSWLLREQALVKNAREAEWRDAVEHTERLRRLERSFLDPTLRDGQMADEVSHLLEAHAGERIALWLHNAHASAWPRAFAHMGTRLRQRHGDHYLSVGFTLGEGTLRALRQGDLDAGPVEHRVHGPFAESLEAALVLAQPPLFAIDLRSVKGEVERWLTSPTAVTEVGFVFASDESARRWTVPRLAYDLVLHVDVTRAAVGLPK